MNRIQVTWWLLTTVAYVYLPWHALEAVIIFTYNKPETAALNTANFSLSNNMVDDIATLTKMRDRFASAGPFGIEAQQPAQPGGSQTPGQLAFSQISPQTEKTKPPVNTTSTYEYQRYYSQTLDSETDGKKFPDLFNLYSRGTIDLTYRPSDVTMVTEVFQADPQLSSVIDYYVQGQKLEPGGQFIYYEQTVLVEIIRKDNVSFGGTISQSPTVYNVICPKDKRVVFDISEIESLPTYTITTRSKGCNITISQLPSLTSAV